MGDFDKGILIALCRELAFFHKMVAEVTLHQKVRGIGNHWWQIARSVEPPVGLCKTLVWKSDKPIFNMNMFFMKPFKHEVFCCFWEIVHCSFWIQYENQCFCQNMFLKNIPTKQMRLLCYVIVLKPFFM